MGRQSLDEQSFTLDEDGDILRSFTTHERLERLERHMEGLSVKVTRVESFLENKVPIQT